MKLVCGNIQMGMQQMKVDLPQPQEDSEILRENFQVLVRVLIGGLLIMVITKTQQEIIFLALTIKIQGPNWLEIMLDLTASQSAALKTNS